MEEAPFDIALSEGPTHARAYWLRASDGVRLRSCYWSAEKPRGTVVIFNGRTEFCEKYGLVARDLTASGYSVATLDWRGQGRSDRLIDDRRLGHVGAFSDFQLDADAFLEVLDALNAPRPFFLVGHSMGGAIALRRLLSDHPFDRAVFSAPMWGIKVSSLLRPVAATLPRLARLVGRQNRVTPGTVPENYIAVTPFEENTLTNDPEAYALMLRQVTSDPDFALGGPSLHWFDAARTEIDGLFAAPRPTVPCKTFVGTKEQIVDAYGIEEMHRNWPSASLVVVEDARHELMMEDAEKRRQFMSEILAFFGDD